MGYFLLHKTSETGRFLGINSPERIIKNRKLPINIHQVIVHTVASSFRPINSNRLHNPQNIYPAAARNRFLPYLGDIIIKTALIGIRTAKITSEYWRTTDATCGDSLIHPF
jgi:hypothetical protein